MTELLAGVLVFTLLMMTLVTIVLVARRLLAPRGTVTLHLNEERALAVQAGYTLLEALVESEVHLPSACGGKGTCGHCRVRVTRGGGSPVPLESDLFTRRELGAGARLACQVVIRGNMDVTVPAEILDVQRVETTVRSSTQVATLMKELVLALPPDAAFRFRTGSFVQVRCPPYALRYADLDVDPAYEAEWKRLGLRRHAAGARRETTRAYSLANHEGEPDVLMLVVRLATPPAGAGPGVPPGIVSSWIFGLEPGDAVSVAGPYGHFFVEDTERELVFVGGGAGMAPMRAHILDLLERRRVEQPVTFFYGARSKLELFYDDLFDRLASEHPNFRWVVALSEPREEDGWRGPTGFIHEHVRTWAQEHPDPAACGFYLCGPPLMIGAVKTVLAAAGVAEESIHADDFGG